MPYIVKEQQKTHKYRFPQCQKICRKLLQQMGYYKISFKKKGKKIDSHCQAHPSSWCSNVISTFFSFPEMK